MAKHINYSVVILAVAINCLLATAAFAGFGFSFGNSDVGKSGLDFAKGYDANTVTTVNGRVASPPRTGENEHIFIELKAGNETISLNLGPKSFWEKKEIPVHTNDEIIAKGSKAQGKDGKTYLMVQKLTNSTTGSQIALRNEQGASAWSGWNSGGMMQGGGMSHGGGTMRGGGGMMRH